MSKHRPWKKVDWVSPGISSGSIPDGDSWGRSWDNTWGYNSPEGGASTLHSFKRKDYCKRECISVHLGQAGVQIGSACWQLYCMEHNLGADGRSLYAMEGSGGESFFQEAVSGKFVPRAVLVDLEPSVLDQLRTGEYRELYHPDQLLSGCEDASNNFARGYYTVGQAMLDPVLDWIRRMADDCDSLQGFFLFHSLGGGTGSGFTTLLLEALNREFHKKTKLAFAVYPSPKVSSAVVEPYNAVITTHSCMDFVDCSFMMDNEALYESCVRRLDIACPTFTHLNRIIGQVASSVTASLRFKGALNIDMSEFQTNLVPFPRLHFPVTSYAPLVSRRRANHESVMVRDITASCFSRSHQLVLCDMTKGKYMACFLLYRGDVAPKDVNTSIARVKKSKSIRFVDWSPTGFKVGINCQRPSMAQDGNIAQVPRAVCMMANNSAIAETWRHLGNRFDVMFSKRAFVHWYNRENMCTEELSQARYDLSTLRLDYNEINETSE